MADHSRPGKPEEWTIEMVGEWLGKVGLEGVVEKFKEEEVDGSTMVALSGEELRQDLGLKLGQKRLFMVEREKLLGQRTKEKGKGEAGTGSAASNERIREECDEPVQQPSESAAGGGAAPASVAAGARSQAPARPAKVLTASQERRERMISFVLHPVPSPPGEGKVIPKGHMPRNRPLTTKELEKLRRSTVDPVQKARVQFNPPLSEEELACWAEQLAWLRCPITDASILDNKSILGVGLYHSPRFLSDLEKHRSVLDEESATLEKQRRRVIQQNVFAEQDDWERDFQVYPRVTPPPQQNIGPPPTLPDNATPGRLKVVVGPVFDIRAYNDGVTGTDTIPSAKDRGILSMDQQYDAVNFLYYVERAKNSYQMNPVTNRLSLYINGSHGSRVFPTNIESQLALLLWRNARYMKKPNGKTDQALLGHAIRVLIPRIIQSIIMEVVKGSDTALDTRKDDAFRTYFLIHQVAIKLLSYYPRAYEYLYRTVMRFIQNPFEAGNEANWPDLEELLISSALVGIPWPILREAFVRRLFADMLGRMAIGAKSMSNMKRFLEHMFVTNQLLVSNVCYEFCFLVSNRNLKEIEQVYERCCGSIPRREREDMKERVRDIRNIKSIEQFWVFVGMASATCTEAELRDNIQRFVLHLQKNVDTWRSSRLLPENIDVPRFGDSDAQVSMFKQSQAMEEMRKLHEGYPSIPKEGLKAPVCGYCGRKFRFREQLFGHLRKFISPERMIRNWHKSHFEAINNRVKKNAFDRYLEARECPAAVCKKKFNTDRELVDHWNTMGCDLPKTIVNKYNIVLRTNGGESSGSNSGSGSASKAPAAQAPAPQANAPGAEDDAMNECVMCLDKERQAVYVPCGHMVACKSCAKMVKECPICRSQIVSVVYVFYS